MQSLTRNQPPPTGKTARTEILRWWKLWRKINAFLFVRFCCSWCSWNVFANGAIPLTFSFKISLSGLFYLSLSINYFWYYDFIYKDHLFQWVPLSNFCRPSQAEIEVSRIQGWSKIHKQFLYSESRKVRNKRLNGKCFIFNNIFNIFWQLQWYKLILLIAIYCNCTWSRTARLLTTNNPRYSDNDTFSASSVVTFRGLFCNMSSITEIYLFWGRGGRGGGLDCLPCG